MNIQQYKATKEINLDSVEYAFSKEGIPFPRFCPDCKSPETCISKFPDGAMSIECQGCFSVIDNIIFINESGRKIINQKYRKYLNIKSNRR